MAMGGHKVRNDLGLSSSSSSSSDEENGCQGKEIKHSGYRKSCSYMALLRQVKSTAEGVKEVEEDLTKCRRKHQRRRDRRESRPLSEDKDVQLNELKKTCHQNEKEIEILFVQLGAMVQFQKDTVQVVERLAKELQANSGKRKTTSVFVNELSDSSSTSEEESVLASVKNHHDRRKSTTSRQTGPPTDSKTVEIKQSTDKKSLTEGEENYYRGLRHGKTVNLEDNRLTFQFDLVATGCTGSSTVEGASASSSLESSDTRGHPLSNLNRLVSNQNRSDTSVSHSSYSKPVAQSTDTASARVTISQGETITQGETTADKKADTASALAVPNSCKVNGSHGNTNRRQKNSGPGPDESHGLRPASSNTRGLSVVPTPPATESQNRLSFDLAMASLLRFSQPQDRIPMEIWTQWAVETDKAARENHEIIKNHPGVQTVFCVDISESMRGDKWKFVKEYILSYISYAQTCKEEEFLALIVFGHETRVIHQLTLDYEAVKQSLERIQPDGPTTMYGGMYLTHAIVKGGSCPITLGVGQILVQPRVVLMTDGYLSPSDIISGPDQGGEFFDILQAKSMVQKRVEAIAAEDAAMVFTIPVGDQPNEELLTLISSCSGGIYLKSHQQQQQFIRSAHNYQLAGRIVLDMSLLAVTVPNITDIDKQDIGWFIGEYENLLENANDDQSRHGFENMIPIGCRVKHGPDWQTAEGQVELPDDVGTVIGLRREGYVRVHWDSGLKKIHKYGIGGRFDVITVDVERILSEEEKTIQVGCLVKKGPDWPPEAREEEEPTANAVGVVYRVQPYRVVRVCWPNGLHGNYKFGYQDEYAVVPIHPVNVEAIGLSKISALAKFLPNDDAQQRKTSRPNKNIPKVRPIESSTGSAHGDQPAAAAAVTSAGGQTDYTSAGVPVPTSSVTSQSQSILHRTVRPSSCESVGQSRTITHRPAGSRSNPGQGRRSPSPLSADRIPGMPGVPYVLPQPPSTSEIIDSSSVPQSSNSSHNPAVSTHQPIRETVVAPVVLNIQWQYKTKESWKTYPADICRMIEMSYTQEPRGSAFFYIGGQQYKVMTGNMKSIHLGTHKVTEVQRIQIN